MGFRCVAVVGDGKGRVGVGCQAGREVGTAVKRALVDAKKVRGIGCREGCKCVFRPCHIIPSACFLVAGFAHLVIVCEGVGWFLGGRSCTIGRTAAWSSCPSCPDFDVSQLDESSRTLRQGQQGQQWTVGVHLLSSLAGGGEMVVELPFHSIVREGANWW